jgi:hypothetical protein
VCCEEAMQLVGAAWAMSMIFKAANFVVVIIHQHGFLLALTSFTCFVLLVQQRMTKHAKSYLGLKEALTLTVLPPVMRIL